MISPKKIPFVTLLSLLLFSSQIWAEVITVGNVTGTAGATVTVPISLDIAGNVQGVAFTVNYDDTNLTLNSVTSPFFGTFTDQWNAMNPVPDPLPPGSVEVDSVTYTSPIVWNDGTPGADMIAAAKVEAGGTETVMFNLQFTLASPIADGIYPVSVSTTFINNTSAGYPAGGMGVPLLFPVQSASVISGRITVGVAPVDTDSDGIADSWEQTHFGNLTTASELTDFDKDGYSDLQEYLNDGTTDPKGAQYNPKVKNAAGGVGYNAAIKSNIWILMLPAILNMNNTTP